MGALLDLHIGFGYVLSHDTQAEKLQAADEDDDTDGGSPAWDRIIEDQLSDDDGYQDQKGKTGHGRSEPGGDGQRYLREIDDAADGVFKQLPEVPFGFTGYAFDIFVGEPAGAETDPAEDSLGKAVVLTHGDNGIHHTAFHQTEVSGTVHNICIRDLIDQSIKFPGKKAPDRWLSVTADTSGGNAVIFSGFQLLQHFREKGRRILKISVHYCYIIAAGIAEACIHGSFLSEVSGKGKIDHMRILFGKLF